jgi:ssRNA-specific RNase YbeY (16S rRNA maturation enzyme)
LAVSKKFKITQVYKGTIKTVPLLPIKEAILGKDYNLSLVYTDKKLATKLHKEWKKKDGPANTLAFPLDKTSGEIFLYPKAEFPIAYLFIHSCCHLKGHTHGPKMEKEEKKWRAKFGIEEVK